MKDPELQTWHVDLEINSSIPSDTRNPRQQAFIVFNFHNEQFELKNLSEEQEIFVNGSSYTYVDDPIILENNDMVQIGGEDFVFLIPTDSKINLRNKKVEEVPKADICKDVEMQEVEGKEIIQT